MSVDGDAVPADARSERLLALAEELELRDAAIAAQISEIAELAERAGAVRARAAEIRVQLAGIPVELEALAHAERDAEEAVRVARAELTDAEARLTTLEGARRRREDEIERARRTVLDAREAVADAEARVVRLEARGRELRDLESTLEAEADGLVVPARSVAEAIGAVPRVSDAGKSSPGSTLADIDEWGARTRVALFVARGTLDAERERIVAEAESLGAAVLGEDLAGASVTLVRRRLEQALSGMVDR